MIDNDFRYLRNAATFKDIRAGENGLELFKVEKLFIFSNSCQIGMWNCYWNYHYVLQGEMKGHENKYDWTFKDEDTYTLTIKNPTVDEEGTYNVSPNSHILIQICVEITFDVKERNFQYF